MTWRGIPEFMHKRDANIDVNEGESQYLCGVIFRSWSNKWMNSYSDICEYEGVNVFRFTSGKERMHLPLCPVCYEHDDYNIPKPQDTAFNEVSFLGEHGYEVAATRFDEELDVVDEVRLNPIYLWDYIK